MGVKQGEPRSPLLFIVFLSDLSSSLRDDNIDSITLEEIQIFLLLFADDTVLFSHSREGLQVLLNKICSYCRKSGMYINTDKMEAKVFKTGTRLENVDLFYDNKRLNNVSSFTYLGVMLSSNGKFYQTQKAIAPQATKALFSLNSLFEAVSLDVTEKLKLFDTMILPILNYGSEVLGFHSGPDIERVHLKFMKQILGVRPQTTNSTVYGELGRVPLQILRKERILKYWFKIMKSEGSLLNKGFNYQVEHGTNAILWADEVKKLLNDLGFNYLWQNTNVSKLQLNNIIRRLHDQYLQTFYLDLRTYAKLSTYKSFKSQFNIGKYIKCVTNSTHRIALTRLCCSAHRLAIEKGRFRNIDRAQRLCTKCNM